jgi:iron-sulfur cluster repair protein YtfE (RIC family)
LLSRIRRIEAALITMHRYPAQEMALGLRREAKQLLAETDVHATWEERTLVPALAEAGRNRGGPDVACTAWMLETNHALAAELLDGFLNATMSVALRFDDVVWASATLPLRQACALVKEQVELEEALLFDPALRDDGSLN